MNSYAGVKFADKEHIEALREWGVCAFVLSKSERETNHPKVGEIVHLLLDDTSSGRKTPVRLIAEQELPNGGCISIYVSSMAVWPAQLK